jgi:hypothetical protein
MLVASAMPSTWRVPILPPLALIASFCAVGSLSPVLAFFAPIFVLSRFFSLILAMADTLRAGCR